MKFSKITLTIALTACVLFIAPSMSVAQLSLDAAFSPNVTDAPGRGYISLPLPAGKVLVGGSFTVVNGTVVQNLARVNSNGSLDTSFNPGGSGPDQTVFAMAPVAGGKILIAGSFRFYNGVAQSGVTRINADGTLDNSFNPGGAGLGPSGTVQTINLQSDGKILISGSGISSYNGNISISIARLNSDGTFDSSFTSGFTSSQFVEEIRQTPGGDIFISGGFFNYGGVLTPQVALLSPNGTLDLAFNANVGTGPDNGNGAVFGSEVQPDGKILICGVFQDFNGAPRNSIARLNTDGTLDATFVPGTNSFGPGTGGEYFSLQPDGKILVAGSFDSVTPRALVRLNADGSLDAGFATIAADTTGYSVAFQTDSKIVLTGFFTEISGASRLGIVRLNANGTSDLAFNAGLTDFATVSGIVIQPDGKIIAAGNFLKAQGVSRRNIARFNANGTLDLSFDPGTSTGWSSNFNNNIQAIALQPDGKIVAAGFFLNYNGSPASSIVRINSDGSFDPTLDTSAIDPFFAQDVVVLPDGSLVASGAFFTTFGTRRLVHLSSTGVYDSTFANFSIGGSIFRIVQEPGGSFLIGGNFAAVAGQPRPRVARLNSNGSLDASFDAGLPNDAGTSVQDISVESSGNIMIGGLFTSVGGQSRNGIARLLPTGFLDSSFNPGTGADGTVFSIAQRTDGKYFIGGAFTNFNSAPSKNLVLLNSDGSIDPTFTSGIGPHPANLVRRLLFQPDGKLLVGGSYNLYAGSPRGSLVRLANAPTDKNQCKNGGWQAFTQPAFRNQGDCVSYVNSLPRN